MGPPLEFAVIKLGRRRSRADRSHRKSDRNPGAARRARHKTFVVGRRKAPVEAVTDLSMRVGRGDIHGVLGANGRASRRSSPHRWPSDAGRGRVEVFAECRAG